MNGFFIKYGEKEHLQQIVDGKIRFTPSQNYIKMEEEQHNKGQGDLLEGKMKIQVEGAKVYHPETNEFLFALPKSTFIISIQDVSNMPIFCLSYYESECIKEVEGASVISIDKEHLLDVKKNFPQATHALVILEPESFISSIDNIDDKHFVHDHIKYYDYEINPIQMYMYLATGEEKIESNKPLSMTYENRYRHLLCKDTSFENQKEYRFIGLNDLIKKPVFYDINFKSKYIILPIDELEKLAIKR